MKQIGLMKAVCLVFQYKRLSEDKRKALQKERFSALVNYAKQNSPYFKELYKELPKDFQLSDLPLKKMKVKSGFLLLRCMLC